MVYVAAARPGSKRANEGTSRPITEPVPLGDDMTIGPTFNLEDPDLHYVYVCIKVRNPYLSEVSSCMLEGMQLLHMFKSIINRSILINFRKYRS